MRTARCGVKLVLLFALSNAAELAASAEAVVDTASLLRNLYDLDRLALLPHGVCKQFSSYDRHETNADVGNYLSIDENRTAVLADMKGPGAIVRIWSANPHGTLKIYVDGQPVPVIDCPFPDFFKDPRLSPIRINVCGGWTSYWPIPYAKTCKVIVERPSNFLYWQITYQTYSDDTKVETYTKELTAQAKAEQAKALEAWRDPAGFVPERSERLGKVRETLKAEIPVEIAPGKNASVFSSSDPGCIDALVLRTKASLADLKRVVLRAYWDGETNPSIESPLPDFFGSGYSGVDLTSLPMVMKRGDSYLCRFPMPFARSAKIHIENGSGGPLVMKLEIEHRRLKELAPNAMYFQARWHREMTKSKEPFTILNATGQGRFVGCNLTMQGGDRGPSYLEGDELVFVDGEKKPSLHGTGTEDYLNCGWYFAGGLATMPLYGATGLSFDFDGTLHRTAAYRFHVPDDIPFARGIAVRLEHGLDLLGYDFTLPDNPRTDKWCYPGTPYACTAYYYQRGPHAAASTIASAAAIDYSDSPGPPARDAVESEDCNPRVAGGRLERKKWDEFAKRFRGTMVPTLAPDDAKDALHFSVPVKYADRYEVLAFMVRGRDYGACDCSIGGQALGQCDLYADCDAQPSGPVRLGVAVLKPGANDLELAIKGRNVAGKLPKIGVDRLMLQSQSKWIPVWQVIGPFDNRGADVAVEPSEKPKFVFGFSGIDEVFPPEKDGFVPGKSYRGKTGDVAWKSVQADPNGHVDLAGHLGLAGESNTGYLYTRIDSPKEMDTELQVAPSDSLKVWLNNREIFRCELVRNQDPGYGCWMPLHLKKGQNTLLLKVTHSLAGFWGCLARVRDAEDKLRYEAAPLTGK